MERTIESNRLVSKTYTAEQVAAILGVSVRKVYLLCEATKDFKVIRMGNTQDTRRKLFGYLSLYGGRWAEETAVGNIRHGAGSTPKENVYRIPAKEQNEKGASACRRLLSPAARSRKRRKRKDSSVCRSSRAFAWKQMRQPRQNLWRVHREVASIPCTKKMPVAKHL